MLSFSSITLMVFGCSEFSVPQEEEDLCSKERGDGKWMSISHGPRGLIEF
jgi:hypothetical protein